MKDLALTVKFLRISRARLISTANEIPDSKWRQSPATEIVAHLAMIEESIVAGCRKVSQAAPLPVPCSRKFIRHLCWRRDAAKKFVVHSYWALSKSMIAQRPTRYCRRSDKHRPPFWNRAMTAA